MHRVLVLYLPPDDAQAFRTYYEEAHLPLAAGLPGQRSLRYSFDVTAAGGSSPYFAVAEAEFDDAESLAAALTSPAGQRVLADIPTYATGGAVVLDYPVREVQLQPQTGDSSPPMAAPARSDVIPGSPHTRRSKNDDRCNRTVR